VGRKDFKPQIDGLLLLEDSVTLDPLFLAASLLDDTALLTLDLSEYSGRPLFVLDLSDWELSELSTFTLDALLETERFEIEPRDEEEEPSIPKSLESFERLCGGFRRLMLLEDFEVLGLIKLDRRDDLDLFKTESSTIDTFEDFDEKRSSNSLILPSIDDSFILDWLIPLV
jgi:hypothetical protein